MYFCSVRKKDKKGGYESHDSRPPNNLKNSPAKVVKINNNLKNRKMKNQEVINNFFSGFEKGKSSNGNLRIETNENKSRLLVNYSTVLAIIEDQHLKLNLTKYSQTTTKIQNCILNCLKSYNFDKITELNNIEKGTQYL